MIEFVVSFEKVETFSAKIFAKSEEDCIRKAGKLSKSVAIRSKNKNLSLIDQNIKTDIYLAEEE